MEMLEAAVAWEEKEEEEEEKEEEVRQAGSVCYLRDVMAVTSYPVACREAMEEEEEEEGGVREKGLKSRGTDGKGFKRERERSMNEGRKRGSFKGREERRVVVVVVVLMWREGKPGKGGKERRERW